MENDSEAWTLTVPPHAKAVQFRVALCSGDRVPPLDPSSISSDADQPAAPRWPQVVTTKVVPSNSKDTFVLDDIPLPTTNPWQRNVRLCDVQFFPDGTAAGVTLDGDVWMIRGLGSQSGEVQWRRFA